MTVRRVARAKLASAMLALGSPFIARRFVPAVAAIALPASSVALTIAWSWAAILLILPRALQEPAIASRGEVHRSVLAALDPVPHASSLAGAAILLYAAATAAITLLRRRRTLVALRRLTRRGSAAGDLVLLAIGRPLALALAGRRRLVLLSRPLLTALNADERRVVLAHERAHTRHRHDRYRLACSLAAAANPLLRGMRRDVDFALERWADEDAARVVRSRSVAARALTRAALVCGTATQPDAALAFERLGVAERVLALQQTPPAKRMGAWLGCASLAAIGGAAAIDATLAPTRILVAAYS